MTLPSDEATTIDLRTMPRACEVRRQRVTGAFDRLGAGESLLVISDHRPTGLATHLSEVRTGTFEWEEVEDGPEVFRVAIRRLGPDPHLPR
jgi:uncharacterized protein (DUF2249 family)